jgi:hypothetical protein
MWMCDARFFIERPSLSGSEECGVAVRKRLTRGMLLFLADITLVKSRSKKDRDRQTCLSPAIRVDVESPVADKCSRVVAFFGSLDPRKSSCQRGNSQCLCST